jgi:hypothetical protein
MNYTIEVKVDLSAEDDLVRQYCEKNQYDVPSYEILIGRIQTDLEMLDGVEEVIFAKDSYLKCDMGTNDFLAAKTESDYLAQEIFEVFKEHGVRYRQFE